jgi:hypothetical protein
LPGPPAIWFTYGERRKCSGLADGRLWASREALSAIVPARLRAGEGPDSAHSRSGKDALPATSLARWRRSSHCLYQARIFPEMRRRMRYPCGLRPLAKGDTLERDYWESDKGLTSVFQEAARVLRRGTPYRER